MLPPHARVVLAGFSQGAWVAINAALQADVVVAGRVIMVAPFAARDPDLPPAWRRLRVSILVGERDSYREPVELFAQQLLERQHHVALEVIPGLGHEYPADFRQRLHSLLRP
jgi:predicted esterase